MLCGRTRIVTFAMLSAALWGAGAPADEPFRPAAPKGAQATALVAGVAPSEAALAGSLIALGAVQRGILQDARLQALPAALRERLEGNYSAHVTARPIGPKGSACLAIDVRGCPTAKGARQLALAAADALANQLARNHSLRDQDETLGREARLKKLQAERDRLKKRLESLRRDLAGVKGTIGMPLSVMTERHHLLSVRAETIARRIEEARAALSAAGAASKWLAKSMKDETAEGDLPVQDALAKDPLLTALQLRLLESELAGLGVRAAPAGNGDKAIALIKRRVDQRRKEIIRWRLEAGRQENRRAIAEATCLVAELTKRLGHAKAEQRDLAVALLRFENLREDQTDLRRAIADLDRRTRDIRLAAPPPTPRPVVVGVFRGPSGE